MSSFCLTNILTQLITHSFLEVYGPTTLMYGLCFKLWEWAFKYTDAHFGALMASFFEIAANFGVADSKRVSKGTCVYSVFSLCGLHTHHLKHISVRNYRPWGCQRMFCGAALRGRVRKNISVFHHNRYFCWSYFLYFDLPSLYFVLYHLSFKKVMFRI